MGSDSSFTFIHFWLIPPYEICTISEYLFRNSGGSQYWLFFFSQSTCIEIDHPWCS